MVLGGARAENAPGIQRTGWEIETCKLWGEMGNILHVQLCRAWTCKGIRPQETPTF